MLLEISPDPALLLNTFVCLCFFGTIFNPFLPLFYYLF